MLGKFIKTSDSERVVRVWVALAELLNAVKATPRSWGFDEASVVLTSHCWLPSIKKGALYPFRKSK